MELQELIDRIERWKMKSDLGEEAVSDERVEAADTGFNATGIVDESFFDDDASEDEETEVSEPEEEESLEEVDEEAVAAIEEDGLVEEEDFDLESDDEKAV